MIVRATSLAEARARVADGMAPGAGLTLAMARGSEASAPGAILDISGLKELRGIALDGDRLRIGALVSVAELREHPSVARAVPAVARIVGQIGSAPLRRLATIGGNVAWGAGDLVPVLLAHRARLVIGGEEISLEAWDRRGLIEAVVIPASAFDIVFAEKAAYRAAFSPSLVTVAGSARLEAGLLRDVALAVGGGAERPRRLRASEKRVGGRSPSDLDVATRSEFAGEIRAGSADEAAALRARVASALLLAGLKETMP